jgi:hypothetical protein
VWQLPDLYDFITEWAYDVYDQEMHPALSQSPREAWESGLDLGGQRDHRRIPYDEVFRVLTLPGSPRETALVYRNHGIQFHYLLYWNDVLAATGVVGTKVKLRYDPFDISHVYAFVHNHWIECITPSYYGQLHGHSEREIALASSELRAQARLSHTRSPVDAKRLADFLAKIEAHEAVLLQRQRDIENQLVLYHSEHPESSAKALPRIADLPPLLQDDVRDKQINRSGDGKQPKDQLNWIKSMATETGVLHVLIGTYDLLPFCNLDGQMARRGSEIHFARYHMEDEKDCQAFCNALLSLLKQIPLTIDHDALMQRWWYFFEGSIGCIGILKQWLVRALYRALREASTELTRTHLEQSVLPDAKWERMRADARSGEAEFQYAGEPGSYLSDLASLPAFVPGQLASPQEPRPQLGGRGAGATGKRDAHKSKSRPGEPAPRRDQVGKASDEQAPPRCSFSGPIELEAARWLESTVEVVQCPTCGSVSKARLKESSVMIAPHPPRTSRPVRNVTRWTEQGPDWVLVQKKE